MRYAIYEGNMERLDKKMARIQNKCRKYGCDFRCEEVGEEFRELKDDNGCTYTARFVIIEAEGVAVVSGWRFIASVEHTSKGNIINRACDIEIPERYYTGQPMCEHCNSRRGRKDTYIVMNEETGEFKQVGKSCLKDFTNGMSATVVAQYIAAFDDLIKGEEPCEGCRIERYIETEEWLRYVAETIRHFDGPTYCEEIGREAWGYIDYEQALSPEQAASYELTPAKMVAEYVVYRCPDGSILLDWNETLWKFGYPAYPKHRCAELERGFSEGGMALLKLHAAMKEKYLKEGGHD